MWHENVEVTKRVVDAFNRRDIDAIAELATPDFEWFPAVPGAVEGGGYRGRAGMESYLAELRGTWEELCLVVDEFRDLGDRVVILGRLRARGRGSGATVEATLGGVLDFRDGRVSRSRNYLDHGEALRAAGLSA
jgi:ketosteroid isomerase-like protein